MLPVHDYTAVAMARKAGMNCRPLTVPATAGGLCTVPIFVLGKCVPWGLPWGCRVYTALPRIPNRCPKWSCRGKRKRKFILKTRKDIFFIRPVLGSRDVAAAAVATAPPPPRRPSSSSPSSSGRRPSRKSETFFSNRNGEKSSSFFNREDSFSVACFGERKPFDLPQIIFFVAFQERVRELKLACVICISFFFLCLPPLQRAKTDQLFLTRFAHILHRLIAAATGSYPNLCREKSLIALFAAADSLLRLNPVVPEPHSTTDHLDDKSFVKSGAAPLLGPSLPSSIRLPEVFSASMVSRKKALKHFLLALFSLSFSFSRKTRE